MSTLLIRLAAPLQSWGTDSKFEERRSTQREPSKSGVVGLLAAALGRRRCDSIDDLAALNFGVRIDQPGRLLHDYHTARSGKSTYVTNRYYLADAVFLVGLEGEETLLRELHAALQSPAFPLFLGRRSCPPEGRVSLGVRDLPLEKALREELWQASKWYQEKIRWQRIRAKTGPSQPHYLTIVADTSKAGALRRRDLPVTFDQQHRQFAYRYAVDDPYGAMVFFTDEASLGFETYMTEHDAFTGGDEDVSVTN